MPVKLNTRQYSALLISLVAIACGGAVTRPAECARILAVETIGGKSHWNVMSGVLRALVDGGHDVTVFTPFVDGDRENYTEVDISDGFPTGIDLDVLELLRNFGNPVSTLRMFVDLGRAQCDIIYGNDRMKRVLNSRRRGGRFDAVIIEPFWSDCASWSYVATRLDLPLIYVTPLPVIAFMERAITGHVSNPTVVSNLLARHSVPKTFVQRLTNTALLAYGAIVQEYKELILRYTEPKAYDSNVPVPPSLVFVNSHFIIDSSRPTATNVVNVGGIHLKAPQNLSKVRNIVV